MAIVSMMGQTLTACQKAKFLQASKPSYNDRFFHLNLIDKAFGQQAIDINGHTFLF